MDENTQALATNIESSQPIIPTPHKISVKLALFGIIILFLVTIGSFLLGRRMQNTMSSSALPTPTISSKLINTGVKCTSHADCQDLPCAPVGYCPIYTCQQGYCYEDDSNAPTPAYTTPLENKYIDENVQFVLKYPVNWIVSDPYVGSYPEKTWMVNFSPQISTGALVQITTRPTDSIYSTSETWASSILSSNYRKVNNGNVSTVDSLQTIKFEDDGGNIATFFNTTDTLYMITLFKGSIHDGYSGSDSDYQTERTIYEDILKSFKVGTKSPTIPTQIPLSRAPN